MAKRPAKDDRLNLRTSKTQRWQKTRLHGVVETCTIKQTRVHAPEHEIFGGEFGVEVIALQSFHGGDLAIGDGLMGGFNTGKMMTLAHPHRTQAEYEDKLVTFIDKLKRHGFSKGSK